MILADTTIWIDHLKHGDDQLRDLLERGAVLGHTMVLGELALGNLHDRANVLGLLRRIPQATRASDLEVMTMVERRNLSGRGIGFVDAHLLAATLLTDSATLWTRDRRLDTVAGDLGLSHGPNSPASM